MEMLETTGAEMSVMISSTVATNSRKVPMWWMKFPRPILTVYGACDEDGEGYVVGWARMARHSRRKRNALEIITAKEVIHGAHEECKSMYLKGGRRLVYKHGGFKWAIDQCKVNLLDEALAQVP
jgi:hypothetical protein